MGQKEGLEMLFIRLLALTMMAFTAACASTVDRGANAPTYFVVRHLHTPEGERDPDLTADGQRVAVLLAARLAPEQPAAIYVTSFKRTAQTAAPLAARLGLTPIVYDPADTQALVAQVRAGPRPALIVGHSNTVPDIVEQLGGTRPAPLVHADFGDLWVIGPDGTTARVQITGD
jgi:broad specificity phosphatase PhoE